MENSPKDQRLEEQLEKLLDIFDSKVIQQRHTLGNINDMNEQQERPEKVKLETMSGNIVKEGPDPHQEEGQPEQFLSDLDFSEEEKRGEEKSEEPKEERGKKVLISFQENGDRIRGVSLLDNGEITYEGGYTPSEGAALFWAHVQELIPTPTSTKKSLEIERELETLSEERDSILRILIRNKDFLRSQMGELERLEEELRVMTEKCAELQDENKKLRQKSEDEHSGIVSMNEVLVKQNNTMKRVLFRDIREQLMEFVGILKDPALQEISEE